MIRLVLMLVVVLAVLAAIGWVALEARRRWELTPAALPWTAYCTQAHPAAEWLVGIHRLGVDGRALDEVEMFRLPPDVDVGERLDRHGDAIARAHDFNHRADGG